MLGNIVKYDNHQHLLTTVQTSGYSGTCDVCGRAFGSVSLECSECKFVMHLSHYEDFWEMEGKGEMFREKLQACDVR